MSKLTIFLSLILGCLSSVLPHDFKWGVSASAYQTEGAWNISGRGPCIWDYFQTFPGRVYMNETGQIADDFYHKYPGDVQILKSLGVKNFRLSLSWSRLLPTGDVNNINQAGVDFFNSLFGLHLGSVLYIQTFHKLIIILQILVLGLILELSRNLMIMLIFALKLLGIKSSIGLQLMKLDL
jgi:hypothetical protein